MKTILRFFVIILSIIFGLMACTKSDNWPNSLNNIYKPAVATNAPLNVTATSAILNGVITSAGGGNVLEKGIAVFDLKSASGWNSYINQEPVSGSVGLNPVAEISVIVTDLLPNTTYRFKAYAVNEAGIVYGEEYLLVTSYGTVKDKEGNEYQTIKVGNQVWMRENLKSKSYSDETCINGCYDLESDAVYGKHYTWKAASKMASSDKSASGKIEGACPTGWHLPTDGEWQELLINIGIPALELNTFNLVGLDHASMLKEAGRYHWTKECGTNCTGFTVLPAGVCSNKDNPACIVTAFWTSSPFVYYGFQEESNKIMRGFNPSETCGFSIRCIKD